MHSAVTPRRSMREIMARGRVLPILSIHDPAAAVPVARALVAGGALAFEVLLRTPSAPAAVRAMRDAVPEADVGLGTLLTPADVETAVAAGASFGVSPGLTPALSAAVAAHRLPFLPGVATPSEVLAAREHGFHEQKLFPAHGPAGIAFIQALAPIVPDVVFCPTGGVRPEDVAGYLKLPNCPVVGGSWVVPAEAVRAGDWAAITALARAAMAAG
ncbi:MAG: bifunctional 4-hydroxy-2-oxoglutarate aldolase/2-dehydro-3-deoxy-phosphogluconate aldolase [Planctomycetia bacterium]|nr:bifunctional 4-hydroxy-2-oxoglutarate aldolase/2-dehydro-3-deoxy-phosphogluconate aldolase [Planctomycetia bacterium]